MALELIPLGTITAELSSPFVLSDTPVGGRWIFEVESAVVEGDRISAKLKGNAAADWLVVAPDGTGALDVRLLVETDDGALIFVQYNGRVDVAAGGPTYATPRFETGDDRYRWLNKIQAVAKGTLDGSTLTYELYELR